MVELSLDSPLSHGIIICDFKLKISQNYINNESNLNIESSLKKFRGKTLICHGTMDLAVDFQNALNLLSWSNFGSLFKLRTNHTFGSKHPWEENHIPTALDQIIDKSLSFLT